MTHETKAGLVVSLSFLCLVGTVLFTKMKENSGSPDSANDAETASLMQGLEEPKPLNETNAQVAVAPPPPPPGTNGNPSPLSSEITTVGATNVAPPPGVASGETSATTSPPPNNATPPVAPLAANAATPAANVPMATASATGNTDTSTSPTPATTPSATATAMAVAPVAISDITGPASSVPTPPPAPSTQATPPPSTNATPGWAIPPAPTSATPVPAATPEVTAPLPSTGVSPSAASAPLPTMPANTPAPPPAPTMPVNVSPPLSPSPSPATVTNVTPSPAPVNFPTMPNNAAPPPSPSSVPGSPTPSQVAVAPSTPSVATPIVPVPVPAPVGISNVNQGTPSPAATAPVPSAPAPAPDQNPGVNLLRPVVPPPNGANSGPITLPPPPAADDMPESSTRLPLGAAPTTPRPALVVQNTPVSSPEAVRPPMPPVGALANTGSPAVTAPLPQSTPAASSEPQVDSYDELTYRCQAGDSFQSISLAMYKSDRYARALQLHNRNHPRATDNVRQDPPTLPPGQAVYVPPQRVLEKQYASVITNGSAPAAAAQGLAPPQTGVTSVAMTSAPLTSSTAPNASDKQMRVRKNNDYFYEIARRTLGSGDRWTEIYRLNPRFSPDYPVPVGTVVLLPGDARIDAGDMP